MLTTLTGLVIRETAVGESDKFINVLTHERGIVSIYCHRARSIKSKHLSSTQLFCYSEFMATEKNDRFTLHDSTLIESFFALRGDLTSFALAQYVCSVASFVCSEEMDESDMLRLVLNTLYATASGEKSHKLIKAAFEIACACLNGFAPSADTCGVCDVALLPTNSVKFDIENGCLICEKCTTHGAMNISSGVVSTLRYILDSTSKRLFSFSLADDDLAQFGQLAERYLLHHLDRDGFDTLDFYKTIQN